MASEGVKHFTYDEDVLLLREAQRVEPWAEPRVMDAWETVARTLGQCPGFPRGKDGRSIRSRFVKLVKGHHMSYRLLPSDGRGDDERAQILDEIWRKIDAFEDAKAAKRKRVEGDEAVDERHSELNTSDEGNKRKKQHSMEKSVLNTTDQVDSGAAVVVSSRKHDENPSNQQVDSQLEKVALQQELLVYQRKAEFLEHQVQQLRDQLALQRETYTQQLQHQREMLALQSAQLESQREQLDKQAAMQDAHTQSMLAIVQKMST